MPGTLNTRLACAVSVTLLIFVSLAAQSTAAPPAGPPAPPDATIVLEAGVACDFGLRIDIWENPNVVIKEFTDKNGNVVRLLRAGKGDTLALTNLQTGESLLLEPTGGSVANTTFNPDGTATVALTGFNLLILFPTDVPAGPSTTLYMGRVVFTIDTNEVFTLQSVSGPSTDICAALQ
jgi:hypothetical protein